MKYDVVIVGAGAAGMFAAHELAEKSKLKVLVVEVGKPVEKRNCPMERTGVCVHCIPCHILSGMGGSGALSDGILNIRPDIGGNLYEFMGEKEAWELVKYVDSIYVKHGSPEKLYQATSEEDEQLSRKAASAGIEFVQIPQRHIGSDYTSRVVASLERGLREKRVEFLISTKVEEILLDKNRVKGVKVSKAGYINAKYVLAAPGRSGARWLVDQSMKLGLKFRHGPIDVGVRVEVPSIIMEPVCRINRDPKFHIITKTYDDFVRTFCVNHQGYVVKEVYEEYIGVNGHSMRDVQSENTNFAFLTRIELTEPVENSTEYGESIAKTARTLGGGKPLIQRMGDLRRGRRSTWKRINSGLIKPTLMGVTPGDIAMVMPHRIVTNILEGLERLDKVLPGVASDSTLLYAPEIKYYAMRAEVGKSMETNIPNLFAAGDGAGVSRGLIIASATGVLAARGILEKEGVRA